MYGYTTYRRISLFLIFLLALTVSAHDKSMAFDPEAERQSSLRLEDARKFTCEGKIENAVKILEEITASSGSSETIRLAKMHLDHIRQNPDYDYKPLIKLFQISDSISSVDKLTGKDTFVTSINIIREGIKGLEEIMVQYPETKLYPDIYLAMATSHRRLKEYDKALIYAHKVIDEYPDNYNAEYAQFFIAEIYNSLHDFDAAIKEYNKCLVRPGSYDFIVTSAISTLVSIYSQQGKNDLYIEGLIEVQRSASDETLAYGYSWVLARFYQHNNMYKEAIEAFEDTVKEYNKHDLEWRQSSKPKPDTALTSIISICLKQGDNTKAKSYYERMLKEYPDSEKAYFCKMIIEAADKAKNEKK